MSDTSSGTSRFALSHGLNLRQTTMIAIGGVIGAGLFVGSGTAIKAAGPAVLIAYVGVGVVVVLVMRMLAELAVAKPETGSFSSYASRELGQWAGLTVGWLYGYQWCVTVGFEAAAGAAIANHAIPGVPTWLWALAFVVALLVVNLSPVRRFGQFEFWFAAIKVVAIVLFMVIGVLAIFGLLRIPAPGVSNLVGHGGFFPNGGAAVITAALAVVFSYFGSEVVTVAAGETADPVTSVRRGLNSVVWRILLFYIGSMLIVVTLLPWNDTKVAQSPYTAVLERIGIPGAGVIMNIVVLTAVLSCLNSGIYASSRMFYAMARRGEAPSALGRTNSRGVPVGAVLTASSIGLLTVIADYFLPSDTVYNFLLDSSGAVAVVVYLCITATQLRGRRRLRREDPDALRVRMWGYPWLSIAVGVALLAIVVGMAFDADTRRSLVLTLLVTAVAVIAGIVVQRTSTRSRETAAPESVH